jgi:oxygen-independent coproporphyrinogen-3 oxidase
MNLYVHFPFCRRKCTYCALHSRVGVPPGRRSAYVAALVRALPPPDTARPVFKTIYFGGGSPALCDLTPLLTALRSFVTDTTEWTVELHPLDVTAETLATLRDGGVNRISMGVQSLDDAVLAHMGRGYTFDDAERAFARIKSVFDNAGIDLIAGYPVLTRAGEPATVTASRLGDTPRWKRLARWGLTHCSVYSLILEEKSILSHQLKKNGDGRISDGSPESFLHVPDDDNVLDEIRETARILSSFGLHRYEISNYAAPGYACRHNLAVWNGEDYIGLGDGAHGRLGRLRTQNCWGVSPAVFGGLSPAAAAPDAVTSGGWGHAPRIETVSAAFDEKERKLFRLRTKDGLDTTDHPAWGQALDRFIPEGLLTKNGPVYRLTERGCEVCDALLAELI